MTFSSSCVLHHLKYGPTVSRPRPCAIVSDGTFVVRFMSMKTVAVTCVYV